MSNFIIQKLQLSEGRKSYVLRMTGIPVFLMICYLLPNQIRKWTENIHFHRFRSKLHTQTTTTTISLPLISNTYQHESKVNE
jgi:hypothetical protein